MTRARSLSRLANSNAFTVAGSNNVGIGSTQPDVRLDVNGDMNVTGTLTYEDVTNVETAGITTTGGLVVTGLGATIGGITTFFGDLNFGAAGVGGTITTLGHAEFVGVVTASSFSGPFSGDLSIEDKIVHTGDTNTAIRFPQADTFTVETGGTEAYRVDSSRRILLGHTSSRAIGHASGDGKLQIEGTNLGTSELSIVRNSDNNGAAHLFIGKSRGSSVGDSTVVQDDDSLGVIGFVGADGTDLQTRAAQITAVVDGTPGSNDMPGALLFSTTADGASSPTERFRIDSSGRLLISTTSSTSNIAGYGNGGIQLNSTTTAQACVNIIHRNNSNNTHAIVLAKARDGAANGGRVQDDDDFGAISFQGFDGTGGSSYRQGAEIRGAVDGTPGNTDMPGRLEFLTTPDGSATPTERLRITSAGDFGYGTDSPGCFFEISKDDSGATVQQKLLNRSTDANSSSNNFIYVNGAAAGDPFTTWTVGGVTSWSMGIDNSDSDKLVINNGSNLNSNLISVDINGNVTVNETITADGYEGNLELDMFLFG